MILGMLKLLYDERFLCWRIEDEKTRLYIVGRIFYGDCVTVGTEEQDVLEHRMERVKKEERMG